jgi:isoleucyl-tRNA synthetase
LHRPYIDEVKLKCKCGKEMVRVPNVFDCWFESGSMPYAQWHYPFENKDLVEKTYPADFIAEGLDQTRGWFYTLHVIAAALTLDNIGLGKNNPAFKNVIVNGLILDAQGRKFSKKLKNYPDPNEIFQKYGADSVRYFLLASTNIGEEYRFSEDRVKDVWRQVISGFENCFTFYDTYKGDFNPKGNVDSKNILDQWILSKAERMNQEVDKWMGKYELTKASRLFGEFIEDLSNWYVRRSRRRFQKPETAEEKNEAVETLYYVLMKFVKLAAPFMPFMTEEIYQKLRNENEPESVHLCDYPQLKILDIENKKILDIVSNDMAWARSAVSLILADRFKFGKKVRQPLLSARVPGKIGSIEFNGTYRSEIIDLIKEETNVKEINIDFNLELAEGVKLIDDTITDELKEEGDVREIVRQIQQMRKDERFVPADRIIIYYQKTEFLDKILSNNKETILNEVLADDIVQSAEITNQKEIEIGGNKATLGIQKV